MLPFKGRVGRGLPLAPVLVDCITCPGEWHTWFYFSPQAEIIPACATSFQDDVLTTSLLNVWMAKGKDRENLLYPDGEQARRKRANFTQ